MDLTSPTSKLICELVLSLPWPSLSGGDSKQSQHGLKQVVVVKVTPQPLSILDGGCIFKLFIWKKLAPKRNSLLLNIITQLSFSMWWIHLIRRLLQTPRTLHIPALAKGLRLNTSPSCSLSFDFYTDLHSSSVLLDSSVQ